MRCRQLVELEDLSWWPRVFRDSATDHLAAAIRLGKVYATIVPRLAAALRKAGAIEVQDLCSGGGGGPWPSVLPELPGATVRLSDLHPKRLALEAASKAEGISAELEPVDATAVPARLSGFRTLFTAFHHLPPDLACAVLADAVRCGRGIAVFEGTARTPKAVALMALTPLMVLLASPVIRPLRWAWLF